MAKIGSPEEWKNKIQKSIRELSENSGIEIKSVKLKDSFRVLFGMGELVPFYRFSFNVLEFDVDQYKLFL